MAHYYGGDDHGFSLFRTPSDPTWRAPQRGALGALLGHWAVLEGEPALVALPTGAGKTAVATAVPFLVEAKRTLVVVPSTQLRGQIAAAFTHQTDLREMGAVVGNTDPRVFEVTGRVASWGALEAYDVIVGLPDSVSPAHYEDDTMPPANFFDLVVVDEAHHAPAPTWRMILEHFGKARKVLLTATPRRRDSRRVPGELAFHYPLRSAISENFYKPVEPKLIPVQNVESRSACDLAIRDAAIEELQKPEHATSTLLVRAGTRRRVGELVQLYEEAGVQVASLTSDLGYRKRTRIIEGLKDGTIRAVAVVGMLSEGFDLPRLRLAAYHDKHKSLSATVQLIGRLVRNHAEFPQPSVLVTVLDADVYPSLKGALWELYQEDADWSSLLPGVIDDQVQDTVRDRQFSEQLASAPSQLSVESLRPSVQATVFEVRADDWVPEFVSGEVPSGVERGALLRGQEVFYSTVTPSSRTLLLVTQAVQSPKWHAESGLDSHVYDLHLVTYLPARAPTERPLLLVNLGDGGIRREVLNLLGATTGTLSAADPERLQAAFDALPRVSVSNVGVRNTYAGGRGQASYKMFAGSGVDRGIREADTAQSAIGHAMAQVSDGPGLGAYTSGVALGKSKMWDSRWVPLRTYESAMASFADRYWSVETATNPLLPAVARGSRLTTFPATLVAAVEMNPALLGTGWSIADLEVDRLDLRAMRVLDDEHRLDLEAIDPRTGQKLWRGALDALGGVVDHGESLQASRGHSVSRSFADLLTSFPLTVYFADGHTTIAGTIYRSRETHRDLARWRPTYLDWTDTNIAKETDKSATAAGVGVSVHETLRRHLRNMQSPVRRRWILENDGSGELADLIALEIGHGLEVSLGLWHAKPAGGSPATRVTDMQVVVAQAIKSRRWLADGGVWEEMGARLDGRVSPRLTVVEGSERLLRALLGCLPGHESVSLSHRPYVLRGSVTIAQPGLSWTDFETKLAAGDLSATQIRDLLATFDDALGPLGDAAIACSA